MPRTVVKLLICLACFVVAIPLIGLIAGFGVGYVFGGDPTAVDRLERIGAPIVLGLVGVCGMAGAIWMGAVWMRSIDEAAQEAHKSAWFWGGSIGAAFGGLAVILSMAPQTADWTPPPLLFERQDPVAYAASGAYAMLLLMLLGYGVAWAWWWWKRR